MTPEQAKEYRSVEIFPSFEEQIPHMLKAGDPEKNMPAPKKGFFHRWVEKEFEETVEAGLHMPESVVTAPDGETITIPGGPMAMIVKKQDCLALIEDENGICAYYKPEGFRFTDRK